MKVGSPTDEKCQGILRESSFVGVGTFHPLAPNHTPWRARVVVRGAVQGVGFRPFIWRLATELGLKGWVNNSAQGVFIEAEGERPQLEQFVRRIETEKPPRSFIQSLETTWLDTVGYRTFEIRPSNDDGAPTALVLPDIATCPDCLREISDPGNRRYQYPFTNCTQCGPRFSIIEGLPYDRANTSMKRFVMCPDCQAEYDDPRSRRFHAQPNACPVCGPQLTLWNREGRGVGEQHDALPAAVEQLRKEGIVAAKGLGGFHLMVAASDNRAVRRLRELKRREEKPFALMFPSLASVKAECAVDGVEERLLRSPEAPIVLLRRKRPSEISNSKSQISEAVAPGNPCLGVMLPSTPLHHLLLARLGAPVVATSGNLSDEPICIDEREAVERLRGMADVFLVHNRPIVRHADDSIVRVMAGRELVLRRARGFAPLPVLINRVPTAPTRTETSSRRQAGMQQTGKSALRRADRPLTVLYHQEDGQMSRVFSGGIDSFIHQSTNPFHQHAALVGLSSKTSPNAYGGGSTSSPTPDRGGPRLLAVGAHLKNAVALAVGNEVFLSQHIGELETEQAWRVFRRVIHDFEELYQAPPALVAADLHPDYISTRWAEAAGVPVLRVQHHVAHVLSCLAENEIDGPVLGVAWDGAGYGLDGTVWGGEFLRVDDCGFDRVARFRGWRLPGGDKAMREPRRSALGLLYELLGDGVFELRDVPCLRESSASQRLLVRMLKQRVNSPLTSSVGRLFDAVASIVGLRQSCRFEGQAAMELEFALDAETDGVYPLPLVDGVVDWRPTIEAILLDLRARAPVGVVSARFHNALVESIVAVARQTGEPRVVLTGGCFQNKYLTERAVRRLEEEGFRPYWHQRVPPNDGGIALGQILAAVRWLSAKEAPCV